MIALKRFALLGRTFINSRTQIASSLAAQYYTVSWRIGRHCLTTQFQLKPSSFLLELQMNNMLKLLRCYAGHAVHAYRLQNRIKTIRGCLRPAADATKAPLFPSNSRVLCTGVLGTGKCACFNKFPAGRGSLKALLVLQINDISSNTLLDSSSISFHHLPAYQTTW